jgi:hypothetical protein
MADINPHTIYTGDKDVDAALIESQRSAMRRFVTTLFAPYLKGYAEIRAIRKGEKPLRHWVCLERLWGDAWKQELSNLYRFAQDADAQGYDVYCGVLPRGKQGGKKADIYEAGVIWADLDFKLGEADCFAAVDKHDPDILVLSGNGIHAYWFLDPVLSLTTDNIRRFEAALHARQQELQSGSDSTQDISRILRLPGTLNHKDPADMHPVLLARCRRPWEDDAAASEEEVSSNAD